MKILKLESENVKRLKAVEITPEGNLVVIGGNNGNGKTSVIDSIAYALGGKSAVCSQPINNQAEKAKVVCDIGDLIVTRTFTKTGGGTLKVSTKDGADYSSPQKMLDSLVGRLSFDPLEFATMRPADQLDTLSTVTGLDFSDSGAEKKRLYDERTIINREGKSLRAKFDSMTKYDDAPEKEVSVSDLMIQMRKAQETNQENERKRQNIKHIENQIEVQKENIADTEAKIKQLQEQLKAEKGELQGWENRKMEAVKEVAALEDADEETPRQQISEAEEINRKVRANAEYAEIQKALSEKRKESDSLTEQIKKLDSSKAEQLAAAKFPVDGLSFDENGVFYNELPFDQASDAERLRVSVAMGLAMNPKLKILLVRNGSLLDENNLKMIADMAAENDAQIWLERVGKGKECAVVIEDGEVEK